VDDHQRALVHAVPVLTVVAVSTLLGAVVHCARGVPNEGSQSESAHSAYALLADAGACVPARRSLRRDRDRPRGRTPGLAFCGIVRQSCKQRSILSIVADIHGIDLYTVLD
jgi:hypothetical protein